MVHHRACVLVTNDIDAAKEADHLCVECINLVFILRMIWKKKIMSKENLVVLIGDIEKKDNLVIKNMTAIFQ